MRNGEIFLIKDDGHLVGMKQGQYESEDLLQGLLEKYPNLLAGDQIDSQSPRRWLLISREFGVPDEEAGGGRWSLDHLFLDQDGIPTLVEVKRSSDTRIRREVVGQMLDYAANAVSYWPIEGIRAKFESRCDGEGVDARQVLHDFLADGHQAEDFWQIVKTNLQAGKVRLVFVADEIPSELKRIVEFLNTQMDPAQVLAVEISLYAGEGLRTLVPRVIGQTEEAKRKKSTGPGESRQWDEVSFMKELTAQGKEIADIGRKLLEWSKRNMPEIWWGKGIKEGSFIPGIVHNGRDYYFFAVRTGYKNAHIQMQFAPLSSRFPFDDEAKRREILEKLNAIPGIKLPEDSLNRYPGFQLAVMNDPERLKNFLETMEWVLREVRAS